MLLLNLFPCSVVMASRLRVLFRIASALLFQPFLIAGWSPVLAELSNQNLVSSSLSNHTFQQESTADYLSAVGTIPAFDRTAYNPSVLHIKYTSASGRTSSAGTDAFLDFTLILPDLPPQGRRVELNSMQFRLLLRQLYIALSSQQDLKVYDPDSASRRLFDLLISPVLPLIKAQKITTLLIAADRGLQAVPFAALSDGQQFFGSRFAFSLTPSLGLTDFDQTTSDVGQKLLALGASEFIGLSPLPLVPQEIDRIEIGGIKDKYLNDEFTPDVLLEQAADSRYSHVHVSTHANFVPGGPSRSRLYSGTDPIPLDQLAKLRIARQGVPLELIVFSACRTALGDSESELGFSGLALQVGAKSAVGTLWYVDDAVTSAYFIQMYKYLKQGIPKAESMQLTRQAFIHGLIRSEDDRLLGVDGAPLLTGLSPSQQRHITHKITHPFYWAGIQLMGTPW